MSNPKMKKKLIIVVASLLILIVGGLLLFFAIRKRQYDSSVVPRVAVTFPEEGGSIELFRPVLIAGVKEQAGLYVHETLIPDDEYIPYVGSHLSDAFYGDLYYTVNNNQIPIWQEQGLITDLSRQFGRNTPDMLPALLTLHTSEDDKAVYFPVSWYSWGFYYRKSLFNELDLDVPETSEDFGKLADTLKENGIAPVSMVSRLRWPSLIWIDYLNLRIYGPDYHRAWLNLEIPFTDSRNKTVFSEFARLVEEGVIAVDSEADGWTAQLDALDSGEAAMVLSGSFFYNYADDVLKNDLGWFTFPEYAENISRGEIVSSAGFIVSAQAPKLDNVPVFLEYAVSEDFQDRLNQIDESLFPVRESSLRALDRPDARGAAEALRNAESLAGSSSRTAHPRMIVPLKQAMGDLMVSAVSGNGDIEIDEILMTLEQQRLLIVED